MSWRERVRFDRQHGVAYHPGTILVPVAVADQAARVLGVEEVRPPAYEDVAEEEKRSSGEAEPPPKPSPEDRLPVEGSDQPPAYEDDSGEEEERSPSEAEPPRVITRQEISKHWERFENVPDPAAAVERLRRAGLVAQLDHIVFSSCCCPPHPESGLDADPFRANPFRANPFRANPFRANAGWGCGCCGGGPGWMAAPFRANPFRANADPNPMAAPWVQATGRRRSSALPADAGEAETRATGGEGIHVVVLDTGWPRANAPALFVVAYSGLSDEPDADGDHYLDPAAGHGTFVAGLIDGMAPGATVELIGVLHGYGDGRESDVVAALEKLRRRDANRPHIVNMSFGAYVPDDMPALHDSVRDLREVGVILVAAAGNDATCFPQYPAAFEEVVGVGAITGDDPPVPAFFTNYGPWVDACARGTDLVSRFFDGFDGNEPRVSGDVPPDPDDFHGWAIWSGTSFAAPVVTAAIAHVLSSGQNPAAALNKVLGTPSRTIPMLGTVVHVP